MRKFELIGREVDPALSEIYNAGHGDEKSCISLEMLVLFEKELDDNGMAEEVESVRHSLDGTPWKLEKVNMVNGFQHYNEGEYKDGKVVGFVDLLLFSLRQVLLAGPISSELR